MTSCQGRRAANKAQAEINRAISEDCFKPPATKQLVFFYNKGEKYHEKITNSRGVCLGHACAANFFCRMRGPYDRTGFDLQV
jgi:hypothetical protein